MYSQPKIGEQLSLDSWIMDPRLDVAMGLCPHQTLQLQQKQKNTDLY